ncbi:DUF1800 family protein [Dyadobacter sp. CY351]|uniref:DUF1800 domain-containing protein n=1 Tax=Dyadobacter sp. CY351 TaxID=2909337 RepID=UPI00286E0BCE|nr:DUF1800 family protein [Dyadobacter sp. CY351]
MTAAHLLRRATFGPTQQEIADFTGKTASEAIDILINNATFRAAPNPPIEMDETRADFGQSYLDKPFDGGRNFAYTSYIQYWWIGLMTEQNNKPSVLEKLTAFWQNHFVVTSGTVLDYRLIFNYLNLLRSGSLGSFRDMVANVTKDAGMLIFQNGNENAKEHPNENYGRELQELFTVGQKDFSGNNNYTEQDVKAAAQVLTGWQVINYAKYNSSSTQVTFNPTRHDEGAKSFSAKYGNTIIAGVSGPTAGDVELASLVTMLLSHSETSKFICRKLYRWYVSANVTDEIENQVIVPLAAFFASSGNNFAIAPVIRKLLSSNIFYDQRNAGALIKAPSELMIGTLRLFGQKVPDMKTDTVAFRKMMTWLNASMIAQQLNFLNQPSVFGSLPYYQTGYTRNWINETTLGLRGSRTDALVYQSIEIKPGSKLGINVLGILSALQPNFSDVTGTPAITCEQVLAELSKNLFATSLSSQQKDFLIDSIMMMNSSPRTTWTREWDAYRAAPNDMTKQNTILWRTRALLKYMLRMAEYQLF